MQCVMEMFHGIEGQTKLEMLHSIWVCMNNVKLLNLTCKEIILKSSNRSRCG